MVLKREGTFLSQEASLLLVIFIIFNCGGEKIYVGANLSVCLHSNCIEIELLVLEFYATSD